VSFEIYPAIDILGGKSVRLKKGLRASAEVVHLDPFVQLQGYAEAGARWVHIVDLAAAFGDLELSSPTQDAILNKSLLSILISTSKLKLQVGGGVRSEARVLELFELGVERVVIGTWALREPAKVMALSRRFPGRIVLGLDTVDGMVSSQGWTEKSSFSAAEMGAQFYEGGVSLALFTEVERDGLLTGIDSVKAEILANETKLQILASGGVRDLGDIEALSKCAGVVGVVVGKALAAGTLRLEDALKFQR
jgi:phosphoribosylformimino-5-aminoimidazole carboxamide ribotide isomerase